MNKQILVKLAQVNSAARYVIRTRAIQKQAGWFKKKYEKPGWENDEDAVNQFVKDHMVGGPFNHYPRGSKTEAIYAKDPQKVQEAINNFNAMLRVNRHSDRSAALVDRYFDLWGDDIEPTFKPLAYKGDRYDILYELADDLWANSANLPIEKQKEAQQLWNDILTYLEDYRRIGTKNPSKNNYFDVSEEMLNEPLTRNDVGSLEDATPKQIETWKQWSKKSPLWSYLWPVLAGAGTGALIGSQITDSKGVNGAPFLGLYGALIGSIPGLLLGDRTSKQKQYAERRLNEK